MNSEVTNVPKGSGLGTSSILSGACVKAIFEFMGIPYTEDDLYSHVLCMEQIMATGGGWQDQVGGLSSGIKYITSAPGIAVPRLIRIRTPRRLGGIPIPVSAMARRLAIPIASAVPIPTV